MTFNVDVSTEEQLCMEELKRRTLADLTPALLEDETLFYRFSKEPLIGEDLVKFPGSRVVRSAAIGIGIDLKTIARDFVADAAEAMLRKHIIWREQCKIDRLLTDYKPPEVMLKYAPIHFVGYDKEGSPVLYVDIGNADVKGIFNSVKIVEVCTSIVYILQGLLEKCKAQTKKLGKPVTLNSFIFNFENLTFSNATNKKMIEMFLFFAKTFQDNYPERIKAVFFLNTPFYFNLAFSVVKHVLASVVLSKIRCYNPDEDWRGVLLDRIDAEVLPAFLGGKRTDPDGNPRCTAVIPLSRKVPESCYTTHLVTKKLSQCNDARKVTVTRLSRETWSCEVTEPGSNLEWEFETKSKDIGFSVLYRPSGEPKAKELLPKQRIDTCFETEKGFLRCDKPGTYICVFDNSYSWMYSKELYFRIQVTPPKQENEPI